jgi:hypothetical protein
MQHGPDEFPPTGVCFIQAVLKIKNIIGANSRVGRTYPWGLASFSQPTAERPYRLTQHSHIQPTSHFVAGLICS